MTLHNPENGFCVLSVKAHRQRDLITVIVHAAMISACKIKRVIVAKERPHGLSYSFTLHSSDGPRLVHFYHAYVAPAREFQFERPLAINHHCQRTEYDTARPI